MLIAIEGVDGSGKSTLFAEMRRLHPRMAVYVPTMPLPRELWPVMSHVEVRQLALWSALYDPAQLYVCDRHVSVSGPVYDALHGREQLIDTDSWSTRVRVLYIDAPDKLLERRLRDRGDEYFDTTMLSRARELYEAEIAKFPCVRIDGALPLPEQVRAAVAAIAAWEGER